MANQTFLIVEDNLSFAINLEIQLKDWNFEVQGIATSGERVFEFIKIQVPDFILMDINLNGKLNGIEIAKKLKELGCKIIYITGKNDEKTYTAAMNSDCVGYLVKPFDMLSLKSFIDLASSDETEIPKKKEPNLFNRAGKNLIPINIESIEWLKSDGNYCEIYANGQRNIIRKSMRKALESLPQDQFLQIHKSYAVNLQMIESIALSDKLLKVGEAELPIGRKYRMELLNKIKQV